ncbi:hypothetical protein AYO38_03905 [bacterium SCGC AG-212-C10]|nr:hypothetical protein AYO38_03905 [bacterium SCGC AG-212-C10]
MNSLAKLNAAYTAFGSGDVAGLLALCDPAITFTVPGNSPVSGSFTAGTFENLVTNVMTLSAGTFREEILDLMAGEKYAAAWLVHSFERGGKQQSYKTLHLWGIGSNGFTSWQELPEDQHAFEVAWA